LGEQEKQMQIRNDDLRSREWNRTECRMRGGDAFLKEKKLG
jgi:hypothetical protein